MTSGFNHVNSTDNIPNNRKPTIVDIGNSTVLFQYIDGKYIPIGGNAVGNKFIPGIALPIVELTTEIVIGTPTPLTNEEGTMLDELLLQGMPIIFKLVFNIQGSKVPISTVSACSEGYGFTISNGTLLLNFVKIEDRWEAQTI